MQWNANYDSEGHIEAIDWHHKGPIDCNQLSDGICLHFDKLSICLDTADAKNLLDRMRRALGEDKPENPPVDPKCVGSGEMHACVALPGCPIKDSTDPKCFQRPPENPPVDSAEATARETDGKVDPSLFAKVAPEQLVFSTKRIGGPANDDN